MSRGAAQQTSSTTSQAPVTPEPRPITGLEFPRYFTREGVDPFDEIEWELPLGGHRQREG